MAKNRTIVLIAMMVFATAFLQFLALAQGSGAAKATSEPTEGLCVYYNDKFQGHALASGEKYDKNALTAAHRTFPFGTKVKVTNLKNNKSVVVRVNDRGPHNSKLRIIEVARRAAEELDMIRDGKTKVQIAVVKSD
jgi:rare lipoprotein A